jgi:hypothetical protein
MMSDQSIPGEKKNHTSISKPCAVFDGLDVICDNLLCFKVTQKIRGK